MTDRRQPSIDLSLDPRQAGTLLGSAAWVLGALEIMKDRGHAESDEDFHDLYDSLSPRLAALIETVAAAREAAGGGAEAQQQIQQQIEDAYAPLREAFETWIQLTAVDTFSVAAGQRLAEREDEESAGSSPDPRPESESEQSRP